MSSKSNKAAAQERRARLAAAREQAKQEEARRRLVRRAAITGGVVVLAAGATIAAVAVHDSGAKSGKSTAASSSDDGKIKDIPSTPLTHVKGATSKPPWAAPADAAARVKAAGLPMLGEEGSAEHIHAHLDVIVDGKPVTVPAFIGIDQAHQQISPLHAHDATGVIHIESPKQADFTLGQFMTEWNVSLTKNNIGALTAGNGNTLRVYVNGKERTGNPGAIKLTDHEEIAIVYGKAGAKISVPSSYKFPSE
ncbi:hypothetical protein [Streptomyces beihaiensis]|uniref:Uncharacterized protein n=1 Tax=Streptomyces beihaiensis TaxID=2984495 RepID=A0ABT3TYW7_9ACTN|nr:hypothetical protein [Streptomyces beihaiensis]MCX3061666.1 hypothetical protein [Streptomyces beihaiensis]